MGAVEDRYSGTASGVNNAVTRISNVFANAIFGALAVLFFSATLSSELKDKAFTETQIQQIEAQAKNLGNAAVPKDIDDSKKNIVQQEYRDSFIKAYSNILFIASGLCFAGALMSVIFIRNHEVVKQEENSNAAKAD
jgi:hypothetical protein